MRVSPAADGQSGRSLWALMRYFGKLGLTGFGGPIALAGFMHRDLVQARGWYTEQDYQRGLAFAGMTPGPLAAHLAMWFGFLQRGALGALLVPLPMIAPPVLLATALAAAYAHYEGLPWVQQVFVGVGPVVLVIVARAALKLARSTNKRDPLLWAISALVCAVTVFTRTEIVWLFVGAGVFGALYYGGGLPRPHAGTTGAAVAPAGISGPLGGGMSGKLLVLGSGVGAGSLALFFLKVGTLTFGSGLAAAPLLHQGLVVNAHLLSEREFVDTVAVGLITPGPVVVMATFAGYLVDGLLGATIASLAVFVPIYLLVAFLGKPFLRHAERPRMRGFVKGVTASAVGAIAGAAAVIGEQTLTTGLAVIIAVGALGLLLPQRRIKVPEPLVVLLGAVAGLAFA
jgi:chromate transporter